MTDYPLNPVSKQEHGKPPESCSKECEKLAKGKTINELRQISSYFSDCASKLQDHAHENVTMDDFKKRMKKTSSDEIPTENEGDI